MDVQENILEMCMGKYIHQLSCVNFTAVWVYLKAYKFVSRQVRL